LRYDRGVQVFLIRHAEAIPEALAPHDRRHLTAGGREQARALGDRLRWHDCIPTHVWSSPRVEAIETAELVANGLACELAIEAFAALTPDGDPRDVVAALAGVAADASVVMIGHEPVLSAIGALLVGRSALAGLGEAHAARIDDGALRWRFAWDADAPDIATR
jgi:phosphohistidine phosphatase